MRQKRRAPVRGEDEAPTATALRDGAFRWGRPGMAATGLEDMQGVGRSIDVRQSRDELAPKSTATVSPGVTTTIRIIPTFHEL